MRKITAFLAMLFLFTGICYSETIVKTNRVQEAPLLEKMLDQVWKSQGTMMVSSEVSGGTLSAETAHVSFRVPYACKLLGVRANVTTAPTADMIIDINEGGTTLLGTKLYIQSGSETSMSSYLTTSPTGSEYTITDNIIADDAEITVDIDSTTGGKGLKVTFYLEPTDLPTNY